MPKPPNTEDATAARRRWRRSLALLLGVLLGGAAVAFGAWRLSLDLALAQTQDDAQRHLRFVAHELTGALDKYEAVPQVLARHPALAGLLAQPASPTRVAEVNALLVDVARDAAAAAIFLIDANGQTLASSNWRDAQTFVGQNYAYRPYFRDAMASGGGHFYARGSTTGTPGYFIAHRLDQAAGVVVLKVSLDEMESNWARSAGDLMLADARGVVFLASRPEWKYRTLRPLTAAARAELHETQQYGDLPLASLVREPTRASDDLRVERVGTATARLRALVTEQPVEGRGWTLLSFTEIRGAEQIAAGRAWAAALGWVSLLLLLAYLQLRRRRARERLAAQGELRAAYGSLEARIAERTQELQARVDELRRTERTLRATQDELVQAGKLAVLGQMAAGMSHELNQPLAALQTLSDNAIALHQRQRGDEVAENLRLIGQLAERMGRIVRQLKSFVRKEPPTLHPCSVREALDHALLLLAPRCQAVDARIEVGPFDGALCVLADATRLEQVLVNLLRNGLDAVQDQPLREVRFGALVQADGRVLLRVSDTGRGMAPEVRAHLFEPFYTTSSKGTGLGLYLARELCLNNGAMLDYEYRTEDVRPDAPAGAGEASGRFVITFGASI